MNGGACGCGDKSGSIQVRQYLPANGAQELERLRSEGLQRTLGTEIELSYCPGSIQQSFRFTHVAVKFVGDGSVHGSAPKEMVVGPLVGRQFFSGMEEVGRFLTQGRCTANQSCGLHVHVGSLDLGAYELRRLILLWKIMEPQFYSLCSPNRLENHYSAPFKSEEWKQLLKVRDAQSSGEIRRLLLEAVYGKMDFSNADTQKLISTMTQLKSRKASKYDSVRYHGLNLHSHFHRGTVEFRLHHGTANPVEISNWMQLCGWFVEIAARLTDREVDMIVTPSNLLLGAWKRPYGMLKFPEAIAKYAQGSYIATSEDLDNASELEEEDEYEETDEEHEQAFYELEEDEDEGTEGD